MRRCSTAWVTRVMQAKITMKCYCIPIRIAKIKKKKIKCFEDTEKLEHCVLLMRVLNRGVLVLAQWEQIWLASMKTQVQSLASLSGLRVQHCCDLWCSLQTWLRSGIAVAVVWVSGYSSDSTSALGTSICWGWPEKDQKKKCVK